ncbi:OefB [Arthroderma uncinatum]|uniref:OefB n=1 Tax=Arthroderma uncinatum TaxID=74035 RepID=UPI00144AA341|nr:OefB [Arthroderma uncinatum]KAF3490812.1 OefB [Arthroderma uncinatum]
MWRGYGFGSSAASSPSPPSSFPQPAPPPPSPCDGLLDIYPRKTSFSTISGSNTSCAFPSWPNRSSLYSGSEDEGSSSASAYLSDEDLFPVSSSGSNPATMMMESPFGSDSFEDDTPAIIGAPGLTTEEQIRHINEAEDWRMRNYVQAQAQARALQALRAAQLAAVEQAQASRHRKRRAGTKKRRSHVSTTATSGSTTTSACTSASASVASSASSKPV